ncbi:MAG: hypothetical protein LBU65_13940, partial [Planctomycetaceae bacterium]|nr:hypothetical protein [Planctomycetaceae bacterium]
MTTSNFLFRSFLSQVMLIALLLTNLSVNAGDNMSDRQVLEQMQKTAERLLDYKFIKCKYVIKTGLAKSLDDAVKFGPQDEFDSAEVLWLYDGVNELIIPKVKYMNDESKRECTGVLVCSDKMYMASDKYLIVIDNLHSDGVVSLRDDPQYHAKYYHKITLLAEVDISRFIKDEYLTNDRLLGLTERYGCDRIDIDVRLENDNLTVMRSAVFGNNKTP